MRWIAGVAGMVAAVSIVACGGGGDDEDATATAEAPTASVTEVEGSPTPSAAIRDVDPESVGEFADLLAETDGTYAQTDVIYIDLTEDAAEEAIVPVSSGGTQGWIAFAVLTPAGDDAAEALLVEQAETGSFGIEVEGAQLVTSEPVPGPDDPECCPSSLRIRTYAWDGEELVIDSEKVVPNPDGGVKPTSEAG